MHNTAKIDGKRVEILTVIKAWERGYITTLEIAKSAIKYNEKVRPGKPTYFVYIDGEYNGISEFNNVSKWLRKKSK